MSVAVSNIMLISATCSLLTEVTWTHMDTFSGQCHGLVFDSVAMLSYQFHTNVCYNIVKRCQHLLS